MYAKIKDGKLEEFKGNFLKYTVETDGITYYVSVSNPGETELNEAGYYRVIPPEDGWDDEDSVRYVLKENTIVVVKVDNDEEPSVQ